MDDLEVVDRLLAAMDEYGPYYDEVFWEVGSRIREHGEAGKLDLAALICWKRSGQGNWVRELLAQPDGDVRRNTRAALVAGLNDQERLDALAHLPGFKGKAAMATVLLSCYDPHEFGVFGRRAILGLTKVGRPIVRERGETFTYLRCVRELRDLARRSRPSVTARNIALWFIGGE
jgi:hypothetical protein